MFSAFKKLTTKSESPVQNGQQTSPCGVQSMSQNLQKKFAKGCNYNMKIVIRGDKNTGKTTLLKRLQGSPFQEEYIPTEEIQVASINWSYKNTDDIVKVEVWDVVDVAKKRKKLSGLKVGVAETDEFEPGLDAQFLDVYKQTHGVILLFDITKPWTFEYMKSGVGRVPDHIPVIVLANFSDMSRHRQVTQLQISDFVENVDRRGADSAQVRWAESSLRNGFGLKLLHKFFNVPFLALQRQSLLQQIELNTRELRATQEELDVYMETDDANYVKFSEQLTNKRRQAAEQLAPPPSKSIVAGQPSNTVDRVQGVPSPTPASVLTFSSKQPAQPTTPEMETSIARLDPTPSLDQTPSPSPQPPTVTPVSPLKTNSTGRQVDVDTFVPDSGDFDTFLDDENSASSKSAAQNGIIDSSDDETFVNPMVSKFDEDVECEEYNNAADFVGQEESDPESESVHETTAKATTTRSAGLAGKTIMAVPTSRHTISDLPKSPALNEDDLEDFLSDGVNGQGTSDSLDGYEAL